MYCHLYLIRVEQRASVEGEWTQAVHQFHGPNPNARSCSSDSCPSTSVTAPTDA